ncbi:hypothetical protein [Erythrobacter sp. F6033]|uniref:hypothetical protein n=1 Tax=Erythrobacter sp. F6033 TaxID=2926401 RepID=UPI001FF46779|nr:hypothetical protein [Erythrobacter sp. F6033]MCK0127475.1 hypothetical protein [Erythrobacter sp. F6033]
MSKTDTTGDQGDAKKTSGLLPLSPNPATNLLITDIVVRGASSLFRKNVEKRVAEKTSETQQEARDVLDGRGIITTLGLYGASKLATRSPVGLGIVAGGLVLKTLYDRGKSRRKRLRKARKAD